MFARFLECLIVTLFCFLQNQSLAKEIKEITEEMDKNKNLFTQTFPENRDNKDVIEDTLDCLLGRLTLLESVVNQRCHQMKDRLQEIVTLKVWCPSKGINRVTCKMVILRIWISVITFGIKSREQVFTGFYWKLSSLSGYEAWHVNHFPKFKLPARRPMFHDIVIEGIIHPIPSHPVGNTINRISWPERRKSNFRVLLHTFCDFINGRVHCFHYLRWNRKQYWFPPFWTLLDHPILLWELISCIFTHTEWSWKKKKRMGEMFTFWNLFRVQKYFQMLLEHYLLSVSYNKKYGFGKK